MGMTAEEALGASMTYTNKKVSESTGLHREIVSSLPATGDDNTIYMVLDSSATGSDIYDEWLWTNGAYEHIGSTRVDLTDYYNKTQVDTALNGKANTSDIPTSLSSLSDDATHRLVTDTEKSTWNGKADTATTLSEYGITDAYTKSEVDTALGNLLEIQNNAGFHNSFYRGKSLGTALTSAQSDAIRNGSFDNLFIGDYWTINGTVYRIAAFDYWLHFGKTKCATHHVVIVPDAIMYEEKMNASDVTTGGYVGSAMYTTNLASAKTTIKADFGVDHILTHQEYLTTQVSSGRPYSGRWLDSDIELMNEHMVYGKHLEAACDSTSGSTGNLPIIYTIDNTQLPLFALDHSKICIDNSWWLRDVLSGTDFALVHEFGYCYNLPASISNGVRPAFGIH